MANLKILKLIDRKAELEAELEELKSKFESIPIEIQDNIDKLNASKLKLYKNGKRLDWRELNIFLENELVAYPDTFYVDYDYPMPVFRLPSKKTMTSIYVQCGYDFDEAISRYEKARIEINVIQLANTDACSAVTISLYCEH